MNGAGILPLGVRNHIASLCTAASRPPVMSSPGKSSSRERGSTTAPERPWWPISPPFSMTITEISRPASLASWRSRIAPARLAGPPPTKRTSTSRESRCAVIATPFGPHHRRSSRRGARAPRSRRRGGSRSARPTAGDSRVSAAAAARRNRTSPSGSAPRRPAPHAGIDQHRPGSAFARLRTGRPHIEAGPRALQRSWPPRPHRRPVARSGSAPGERLVQVEPLSFKVFVQIDPQANADPGWPSTARDSAREAGVAPRRWARAGVEAGC